MNDSKQAQETEDRGKEGKLINCEPVVPKEIEAKCKQAIEYTSSPLNEILRKSTYLYLTLPVTQEQMPENGEKITK